MKVDRGRNKKPTSALVGGTLGAHVDRAGLTCASPSDDFVGVDTVHSFRMLRFSVISRKGDAGALRVVSLHPSLPPPSLPPQPPACQELIKKLLGATDEEMADELKKVESWSFGKVSPTPSHTHYLPTPNYTQSTNPPPPWSWGCPMWQRRLF